MIQQSANTVETLRLLRGAFETMRDEADRLRDSTLADCGQRIRLTAEFLLALRELAPADAQLLLRDTTFVPTIEGCADQAGRVTAATIAVSVQPLRRHGELLRRDVRELHARYLVLRTMCQEVARQAESSGTAADGLARAWRLHSESIDALVILEDSEDSDSAAIADLRRTAEDRVGELDAIIEKGQTVLSGATERTLADDFAKHARAERLAANRLLISAAVTLVALSVTVLTVSAMYSEVTTAGLLVKLAAGVPLGLLALHLVRESGGHRTASRAADELAVRLRTIGAYVDLEPEHRQALRHMFGRHVFLGGPPSDAQQSASDGAAAPGNGELAEQGDDDTGKPLADLAEILRSVTALTERLIDLARPSGRP